jgi:hypothetical protein
MTKARKAIRTYTIVFSIVALSCAATQMMRYLSRPIDMPPAGIFVALGGAAGVLIALTCFRSQDRSLYLRSKDDQAV